MPAAFDLQIIGVKELRRRLRPELVAGPVRSFLKTAAQIGKERIANATPKDTGELQSSYKIEVDPAQVPEWSRVYTTVEYAPFVEYDTRPHWPPVSALEGWARRHGIAPFLVARAIAQRGTRGRRMFQLGLERIKGGLNRLLRDLARDIERRFVGRM